MFFMSGIDWQVRASSHSRDFNRSIANLLILRGPCDIQRQDKPLTEPQLRSQALETFNDPLLYADWMPQDSCVQLWRSQRPYAGLEKSSALLSNNQGASDRVESIVERAWQMFSSRAYFHHYERHGLSSDDFMDCFASMEQIVASYKAL